MEEKYSEKISKELINTYVEARIYNYGENEHSFFYKRIENNINTKKEEIEDGLNDKEKKLLNLNTYLYQFIFYIDGVRTINDIDEFVKMLCEKRTEYFEIKTQKNFEKKLIKKIKEYNEHKNKYIDKYLTQDFELRTEKYINVNNTYKAILNYNFKLPYIYSETIIDEVYNEGTINEDKLIIEYMLLTAECIKDIEKGDFNKKYLVEFARSLFEKDKKIKQTLRIIDDQIIQDKIILKILYEDFEKYKEQIYDLMQEGYKFAIIIDNTFTVNDANLRKLKLFDYLLVSENNKNYEKIKSRESRITNIIIYDL